MSAALNSSAFTTIFKSDRSAKTRSHESLQSLDHVARKQSEASRISKDCWPRPQQLVSKSQQVSRLELLLGPHPSNPVFTSLEDSTASHNVNEAIRMCSQWSEIQQVVLKAQQLSSSNLAFALYRLGCLAAFASRKRVSDLKQSNLVPYIFDLAIERLGIMEPASLVLLLDGAARLRHQPPQPVLSTIATRIQHSCQSLDSRQLPLVLWAFSSLQYVPRQEVLSSLEDALHRQASELSPQGLTLVLSSFSAADHKVHELTLTRLADTVQRKLLLFKPSELAACLEALSALGFKPSQSFLEALVQRSGEVFSQNIAFGPFARHGKLSNVAS